jgi:hypothetical protein
MLDQQIRPRSQVAASRLYRRAGLGADQPTARGGAKQTHYLRPGRAFLRIDRRRVQQGSRGGGHGAQTVYQTMWDRRVDIEPQPSHPADRSEPGFDRSIQSGPIRISALSLVKSA